jgi:PIN domain nuclease of toxin-antitoxin system
VILLDTNAVIWVDQGDRRAGPLLKRRQRLYISPANLLELQFLNEAGRIRLSERDVNTLADDDRWLLDDPPAAAWFATASHLGWTRDPFDRLLAGHVQFRGWKLATGDRSLLEHLGPRHSLEL